MAFIELNMEEFLRKKKKAVVSEISFTKNGRMTILPGAAEKMGLKAGDGIGIGYNDEKSLLFVIHDDSSPVKLGTKGKLGYLFVQNPQLVERIRTYLKVTHDDTFRAEPVDKMLMSDKTRTAWNIKVRQ
jgi:hypothetical protein